MDAKQFSQEDLQEIQTLRVASNEVITQLGQIEAETFLTHKRLEQLAESKNMLQVKFEKLQEQETGLLRTLTEKYGDGTVDVDSGEFTPAN